ncbi:hypothetical protein L3049_05930 [Labilibaculum sp. DW002]|uniref:Outer membrane protein beta-barrel domain-containing protein n=1 Tax=Paralabilibaculum antarcticum TaxID=2912572 RepID=A0ABT5VQ42_9BACT|nr:hypothetical protein [Labilibaculum sp. DW002]MDE5417543.1 hypothetical protein [Labilibaculum sp. DW002]
MSKKIFIILLFLGAGIALQAQTFNPYTSHSPKVKNKGSIVHSINLTGGLYAPEMDYWNDSYLPSSGNSDEFGSSLVFGGNINFIILPSIRARVGASYWSDKVSGSGAGLSELKVSFTRFSFGGLYTPEFATFDGFQVYTGVELYLYDINNKVDMKSESGTISSEDQNGHDYSFAPLLGIERLVSDHFLVGAEFSYMIGDYNQGEIVESIKNKVSINGPQLTLSFGYKF